MPRTASSWIQTTSFAQTHSNDRWEAEACDGQRAGHHCASWLMQDCSCSFKHTTFSLHGKDFPGRRRSPALLSAHGAQLVQRQHVWYNQYVSWRLISSPSLRAMEGPTGPVPVWARDRTTFASVGRPFPAVLLLLLSGLAAQFRTRAADTAPAGKEAVLATASVLFCARKGKEDVRCNKQPVPLQLGLDWFPSAEAGGFAGSRSTWFCWFRWPSRPAGSSPALPRLRVSPPHRRPPPQRLLLRRPRLQSPPRWPFAPRTCWRRMSA